MFDKKKKSSTDIQKTVDTQTKSKSKASNSKVTNFRPKKNKNGKKKLPRTVQETLDWICVYENGVFQIAPKKFSKMYFFKDISFKTKSDEDQEKIYKNYQRFLNTLQADEEMFITFVNFKENEGDKLASVLPQSKGDKFDIYREEITNILRDKMRLSRNSISTNRYLTITVKADDVETAMKRFANLDGELSKEFKKITEQTLHPLTLAERLEVINTILNSDKPNYWFEHDVKGGVSINFSKMARHGYTTKDILSPESMRFYGNYFKIDDRVGQAMYLDGIANWMDTNFLPSLSSVSFESIITMHITAMEQSEAIKKIHNQSVNINAEVEGKQDERSSKGKDPRFINSDLLRAKEEIEMLQDDILNRDQRLFFMSLCTCHFAENEDILKEQKKVIMDSAAKYMSSIKPLFEQQERGLMTALPLGHDKLYTNRLLTTESLGVYMPFDEVNQFDKNGIYYGVNVINKSLIIYDRTKGQNYNGLVLGASGAGKSFSSKREMTSVLLNKDADVYIIDPEGEYSILADKFDGTVIKISPGNGVYLNPFDLDIDTSYDKDLNPIAMKIDFICGMLETMLGNGAKLTPIQRAVVDRCAHQIYQPYLEHLAELPPDKNGRKRTIDRAYCPTMQNLFDTLLSQPEAEAQNLALVMEPYTTGSFDAFAHRTNVDVDSRLIIYDISTIGTNLMELGLKVCTNEVWTKMINNRKRDRWTWFYIDEFHLLLSNLSTAEFIKTIFKRARKYFGVPTGITQNCEELLASPAARAVITNTSFVYMLNLSLIDRNVLQEMLHLSDGDMEYVTNVPYGHGLIYTGAQCLPFEDEFPSNTELYKIMSTSNDKDEAA